MFGGRHVFVGVYGIGGGPVEVSLRDIIFNCEANRMPFYRDLVYLKLGGLNRARFFLFSPDSSVIKADPGIFQSPRRVRVGVRFVGYSGVSSFGFGGANARADVFAIASRGPRKPKKVGRGIMGGSWVADYFLPFLFLLSVFSVGI